ncbi:hypothetical protein ACVWZK_009468 [Bradyrhizobium sp. GM0.4]
MLREKRCGKYSRQANSVGTEAPTYRYLAAAAFLFEASIIRAPETLRLHLLEVLQRPTEAKAASDSLAIVYNSFLSEGARSVTLTSSYHENLTGAIART